MIDTLLDTNVPIDLSDDRKERFAWSAHRAKEAANRGRLVDNQTIYSELSGGYARREHLEETLKNAGLMRESIPWDAAFAAGLAFSEYRQRGGSRRAPLPDFFIGAHAGRGYQLLTRDRGYYPTYFPTIDISAPDTHP